MRQSREYLSSSREVNPFLQGIAWKRSNWCKNSVSRCQIEHITKLLARQIHATATTSCYVCMGDALKARFFLAEMRWRWTCGVDHSAAAL